MTKTNRTLLFWVGIFVLVGLAVWATSAILMPFILGFALAYLLNPLAQKLECKHLSRNFATTIVISGLILVLLLCLLVLVPVLEAQIVSFVMKIPTLANALWQRLQPLFELIKDHVSSTQIETIKQTISAQTFSFVNDMADRMLALFSGWSALFNIVSFVIITPVVAFYLLADWQKMTSQIKSLFPRKYAAFINLKLGQIDEILSAFVRGQAIVCLFLGLFYGLGLSVIGLDFGFSIGLIAGIFSFIPYVGTLTGFVLSLLLAYTQSADWGLYAGILLVFGVGQFLEGYVLTPKLVGDKIQLHPVWVIFALMAGGSLFGFVGVLVAVPVAAVLGVVVRTLVEYYKKSSFFKED